MECEYSVPVNFEGDPPSSIEYWQFSQAECEIAWPSPVPQAEIATPAAYIDIASSSAIAQGFHNTIFTIFIVLFIVVAYIGWQFGVWIYRR